MVDTNTDIEKRYNEENNVPKEFEKLLKDLIFNDENEKIHIINLLFDGKMKEIISKNFL